jgi:hypothetical protein
MGRNKIKIERITNERTRLATFNKRKNGLVKKAMELAILCGCEVALIVIGNNKLTQYSSSDMDQLLLRYTDGGFDEPQAEPLTSDDYPKLFGKKNKANKESPAKKPRVESPVPQQGAHAPALVKPLAVAPSAHQRHQQQHHHHQQQHQQQQQLLDGRTSPTGPVTRGPSPPLGAKPVSPILGGAARLSAPQQQLAPTYPAASYIGYPSTRTAQFPSSSSSSQSVSRSNGGAASVAPSLYSVPSTAPAGGRVSPPSHHRGSFGSAGSVSPTFDTAMAKPQSPRSSNPPTPPGSGGQYAEEMRRASGGRLLQEQQFAQKLNKKNLSLAIPDAVSGGGNFPGSSSAGHSRHTAYTPGFTGLSVPSGGGMPFMGESDMQHSAVLPSPSNMFFASSSSLSSSSSDTPGSHGEHAGHYLPSPAWSWLTPHQPRLHSDAAPQQERFLSRDLTIAHQDGTLHHQLGKSPYLVGEKRKANDLLKV